MLSSNKTPDDTTEQDNDRPGLGASPRSPAEGALELAALGFRLFPLRRDTKAGHLSPSWKKAATDDTRQLRAWGSYGHNFGAWCRGHLVLDVDTSEGKPGLDSLMDLARDHGELPITRTHGSARGGLHMIFKLPPGVEVSNKDRPLGGNESGLNVRGSGGYIVAPGSTFEGKPYTVVNAGPIAEAPNWLVKLLRRDTPASSAPSPDNLELDSPAALASAEAWLQAQPPAYKGSRGSTTYKAACQLRDYGVSQPMAEELIGRHLASRFVPPYGAGEDTTTAEVEHAYRYAQNAMGAKAVEAMLEPFDTSDIPPPPGTEEPSRKPFADRVVKLSFGPDDVAAIPRRDWIVPGFLLRGYVTVLTAEPAAGKSQLSDQLALAVSLGDGAFMGAHVAKRSRVLLVNFEDEVDEAKRRIAGTFQRFKLGWDALSDGWLDVFDIDTGPCKFVTRTGAGGHARLVDSEHLKELKAYVKAQGIGVVFIDPLVETHEASEASNEEMACVAAAYRAVARECKCAVVIVHHSRKPPQAVGKGISASMHDARGASALSGVARVMKNIVLVSKDDARSAGLPEAIDGTEARYVALVDTKASYGRGGGGVTFFRWVSEDLANGEDIGVLVPARPGADATAEKATADSVLAALQRILTPAGNGAPKTNVSSRRENNKTTVKQLRAAGLPEKYSRDEVWRALESLEATGLIRRETYGAKRKTDLWRYRLCDIPETADGPPPTVRNADDPDSRRRTKEKPSEACKR